MGPGQVQKHKQERDMLLRVRSPWQQLICFHYVSRPHSTGFNEALHIIVIELYLVILFDHQLSAAKLLHFSQQFLVVIFSRARVVSLVLPEISDKPKFGFPSSLNLR